MIYDQPIYTIRPAYELPPRDVASCFGFDGVRETIPYLAPDIYAIFDGAREAGSALRGPSGNWDVDLDGMRAGPGYSIDLKRRIELMINSAWPEGCLYRLRRWE